VLRLAILLSGRGSNFEAIHRAITDAVLEAEVVTVISNRPDARGIARAREIGYATHVLDHRTLGSRTAHEAEVARILDLARPDFICLAGYMRLLSADFVHRFRHRILNIHPSLLPSFPGIEAQAQAVEHGVKISGCTVHFVDEHLDGGPIIVQRSVPVLDDDNAESLAERILVEEHLGYLEALVKLSRGRYRIEGRRVIFG
jgi:phosphoribosylglycinamide formyltransferase-1